MTKVKTLHITKKKKSLFFLFVWVFFLRELGIVCVLAHCDRSGLPTAKNKAKTLVL